MGALSLIGWLINSDALKGGLARAVTMKANTALGLCVLGAAVLNALRRADGGGRRMVRAGGAFVALLGSATLSEHLLGWNLGIDQALFHEVSGAAGTVSPGRMGPPACVSFTLLGTACCMLDRRSATNRTPVQWLALLALPLPLLALHGYAAGAEQLYGIARFTGIALNTALAFLCLALALLLARPNTQPAALLLADNAGGEVARTVLPAVMVLPLALGWLREKGEGAGLYDRAFGRALLLLTLVVVFTLITWRTAQRLSAVAEERTRLEQQRGLLLESERAARVDAERAARSKDEFLATLSHELRTPLNAILGWLTLLLRAPGRTPDLVRPLQVIERSARAQARLIEDLLDVSRIVNGKLRLAIELLDVATVINVAREAIGPLAVPKDITIETLVAPELPVVRGDRSRLQQVVLNLLSNAIKFTHRGGNVSLTVQQQGSDIELRVRDTGIGISAELLPHIFDRFRQADSSSRRAHGGLGLGLAIVKQVVDLHGGTVKAFSPGKDQGATFVVALPISTTALGVAEPDAATAAPFTVRPLGREHLGRG